MRIEDSISWIGHASFIIKEKGSVIFIDPFKVSGMIKEKADLVLLTHAHFDHNSKPDIENVRKETTKFIVAPKCLEQREHSSVQPAKPGFKTEFNGIGIEAVHAYNLKPERMKFHPKSEDWVGYIITLGDMRIYHSGDTDFIPEMKRLKDIDVVLLPSGGTYTMQLDEAAEAAKAINPKITVPMHYKMILGEEKSRELEKEARSSLPNVHIMKEVQDPIYSF